MLRTRMNEDQEQENEVIEEGDEERVGGEKERQKRKNTMTIIKKEKAKTIN